MSRSAHKVVLYTTPGCHLCEDARATLRTLRADFEEIDASEDADRFLRTPVLEIDGREISEGEIDAAAVARMLR